MATKDEVTPLIERHYKSVYSFLRKYHPRELAEEAAQEAAIKAFNHADKLRDIAKFKSWFMTVAVNTALNMRRNWYDSKQRSELRDVEDRAASAETMIENRETAEILMRYYMALPNRQRRSFELQCLDDLAFRDVAEIMNCPYDTAKANYRHALLKLQEIAKQLRL